MDKKRIFIDNIDSIINENGVNVFVLQGVNVEHRIGDLFDLYISNGCPNCDKIEAESPELYVCESSIEYIRHIRFCDIDDSMLPENVSLLSLELSIIKKDPMYDKKNIVTLIYYNL